MISVIVPVFNMEKYLARCIDSLVSQSIKDIEILLIDDGSTDSSADICKKYAEDDKRIKYIYKENGGLSDARNKAIDIVKGEFITFVDADDYVHKTYLEYLFSLINNYSADIATCIHFETCLDSFEEVKGSDNVICMSGYEACERMLVDFGATLTAACGKLYKSEIVKQYKFPYGKLHEDVATTYKYYLNSSKVVYGYKELYAYYQRPDSIIHTISSRKVEDELWAMSERAISLQKLGEEKLSKLSWGHVAWYLKRDVKEQLGSPQIWKKYGKIYIENSSDIKEKLKIYLFTSYPRLGRKYLNCRR